MSDLYRWPDGVLPPQPLNDSYAQKLPDKVLRTDFAQGVPRQRRRYRSAVSTFSVTWPMSPAQKDIFDGLYDGELLGGEAWFNIPVFTGADYVLCAARFVKASLNITRSGGEWIVACQLEVQNYPAPDQTMTAANMLVYGSTLDLSTVVLNFDQALKVTYRAATA